uniref:Heme peroxidase n=1 Tax=Megaselia scalaris TaxID=36166 RepID=T1GRJ0_MEGSC
MMSSADNLTKGVSILLGYLYLQIQNVKWYTGIQRSKVTHSLDGSPIYGSSLAKAKNLRTFRLGKLKMFNDFGRYLLPLTTEKDECTDDSGKTCFKSGDGRTNQMISLVVIYILLAREHNKICDILCQLNPHWSYGKLYQEARKIVIAELQHIVFKEWLAIIIGTDQTHRFGVYEIPPWLC